MISAMAWTNSKIFRQFIADAVAKTASFSCNWNSTDVFKAALFPTGTTPDATVSAANSAYNAGVWTSGTELTDTNWPAGGRAVTGTGSGGGYASSGTTITFDGADTSGAGNVTLAGVFGDLLYDTVASVVTNQGAAFHYFGGSQGVTAGTFTIVWNASGLMQVTF